jgi:FkbM family methyltransferase
VRRAQLFRCSVRPLLRRLGIDVVRLGERHSLDQALAQLRRVGVRPGTVVDVGVGHGTEELYDTFHDARFLLVEPVAEEEPALRRILARVQGDYLIAAAGSSTGATKFHFARDDPIASSLLEDRGAPHDWESREVPVVRIDQAIIERAMPAPYLIKVDVQGSELEVVRGAEGVMDQTEAFVLEVSLMPFFVGGPEFADVVAFMREQKFVVYDVVGRQNRPLDDALGQVDLVFVQEQSRFRSARYA